MQFYLSAILLFWNQQYHTIFYFLQQISEISQGKGS